MARGWPKIVTQWWKGDNKVDQGFRGYMWWDENNAREKTRVLRYVSIIHRWSKSQSDYGQVTWGSDRIIPRYYYSTHWNPIRGSPLLLTQGINITHRNRGHGIPPLCHKYTVCNQASKTWHPKSGCLPYHTIKGVRWGLLGKNQYVTYLHENTQYIFCWYYSMMQKS